MLPDLGYMQQRLSHGSITLSQLYRKHSLLMIQAIASASLRFRHNFSDSDLCIGVQAELCLVIWGADAYTSCQNESVTFIASPSWFVAALIFKFGLPLLQSLFTG